MDRTREELLLCRDSKEVVTKILALPEKQKISCIAMLWVWWDTRNKRNAGEPLRNTVSVMKRISAQILDCNQLKEKQIHRTLADDRWTAPGHDAIKINVDGSMNADTTTGGWGFVLRDELGHARGAAAGFMSHVQDALHAEAMACLQSLLAAQDWGLTKVHVETDALKLVQAIKSDENDMALNGILFQEIKCFARLNFSSFHISYCPRACNKVADALASYGAESGLTSPASGGPRNSS